MASGPAEGQDKLRPPSHYCTALLVGSWCLATMFLQVAKIRMNNGLEVNQAGETRQPRYRAGAREVVPRQVRRCLLSPPWDRQAPTVNCGVQRRPDKVSALPVAATTGATSPLQGVVVLPRGAMMQTFARNRRHDRRRRAPPGAWEAHGGSRICLQRLHRLFLKRQAIMKRPRR